MKKIIFLLLLCLVCTLIQAQSYQYYSPEPYKPVQPSALELLYQIQSQKKQNNTQPQQNYNVQNIENGWYNATVEYSNSNTYTNSTYSLTVHVSEDRVISIDFGNGGSVHTGLNNNGYFYTGGYLDFEKNYNNQIISGTTKVSIGHFSGTEGTDYYNIRLE